MFLEKAEKVLLAARLVKLYIEEYKKLVEDADKLFDVGAVTIEQKAKCKDDWNITMNEVEHRYYEDQKTVRRMECDKKVDPQWYYTVMRRERM